MPEKRKKNFERVKERERKMNVLPIERLLFIKRKQIIEKNKKYYHYIREKYF
jgi:hypothetical protein